MIVTEANFSKVIEELSSVNVLAVDTETTGLMPYHDDVLFSVIISTHRNDFYFNYNSYPDYGPLPESTLAEIAKVLENPSLVVAFHNAKFDLAFLRKEGIEVKGTLVDIWAMDRLHFNDHFQYELAKIAERWGYEKDDSVEEYIAKHKLWKWLDLPHLGRRKKDKFYNQVPFGIVSKYGEKDGRATFGCYEKIRDALSEKDQGSPTNVPKLHTVARNEAQLTKTLFEMESVGVLVDRKYCTDALDYYTRRLHQAQKEFKEITGKEFKKGSLLFKEVFKDETWSFTDKGNPIFDAEAMKGFKHPAAKCVISYSEAKKQMEYFQGFLYFADKSGVIHTNFKQAGTVTGRLSSSEPNLQNLTKPDKYEAQEDDSDYPVRRAFIPRPGYFFAMLDYDQMEYRMMLDMARANGLIDKVMGGLDVHQATADLAGITRRQAKTVNFAVLYGSGLKTLSESLQTSVAEAKRIRETIFRASPEIRDFIRRVTRVAQRRGFIFNWLGRRSHFTNKNFCYKSPNSLIQGGTADVVKVAMNRCHEYLEGRKSRLLLTIHDELVFEIAEEEEGILPELKAIMEGVYPHKSLPLTCGIDYSKVSLADKQAWRGGDLGQETRDDIQGKGASEIRRAPKFLGGENTASIY